jgi:hypothetical protein
MDITRAVFPGTNAFLMACAMTTPRQLITARCAPIKLIRILLARKDAVCLPCYEDEATR